MLAVASAASFAADLLLLAEPAEEEREERELDRDPERERELDLDELPEPDLLKRKS